MQYIPSEIRNQIDSLVISATNDVLRQKKNIDEKDHNLSSYYIFEEALKNIKEKIQEITGIEDVLPIINFYKHIDKLSSISTDASIRDSIDNLIDAIRNRTSEHRDFIEWFIRANNVVREHDLDKLAGSDLKKDIEAAKDIINIMQGFIYELVDKYALCVSEKYWELPPAVAILTEIPSFTYNPFQEFTIKDIFLLQEAIFKITNQNPTLIEAMRDKSLPFITIKHVYTDGILGGRYISIEFNTGVFFEMISSIMMEKYRKIEDSIIRHRTNNEFRLAQSLNKEMSECSTGERSPVQQIQEALILIAQQQEIMQSQLDVFARKADAEDDDAIIQELIEEAEEAKKNRKQDDFNDDFEEEKRED